MAELAHGETHPAAAGAEAADAAQPAGADPVAVPLLEDSGDPWQQGVDPWSATGQKGGEQWKGAEKGSPSFAAGPIETEAQRKKGKGKGGKKGVDSAKPTSPQEDASMSNASHQSPSMPFPPTPWTTPPIYGPPTGVLPHGIPFGPPFMPRTEGQGPCATDQPDQSSCTNAWCDTSRAVPSHPDGTVFAWQPHTMDDDAWYASLDASVFGDRYGFSSNGSLHGIMVNTIVESQGPRRRKTKAIQEEAERGTRWTTWIT